MVTVLSGLDTGGSAYRKVPSWVSWEVERWTMLPWAPPGLGHLRNWGVRWTYLSLNVPARICRMLAPPNLPNSFSSRTPKFFHSFNVSWNWCVVFLLLGHPFLLLRQCLWMSAGVLLAWGELPWNTPISPAHADQDPQYTLCYLCGTFLPSTYRSL